MKVKDLNNEKKSSDSSELFFRDIELEFLVHELKDPLSVIESGMRILLKKEDKYGPFPPGLEKIIKRSLKNSVIASDMLYGLLEIGRSQTGNFTTSQVKTDFLIINIINDTLELLPDYNYREADESNMNDILQEFADYGILVSFSEKVKQADIRQDVVKVRQILGNLIKNALHYRNKHVKIKADIEENNLFINVLDDGPGIEPEHFDLIFERYVQIKSCDTRLKRKKHGLGLATARIMARYLGGDIVIKNNMKNGTDFEISLPLHLEES